MHFRAHADARIRARPNEKPLRILRCTFVTQIVLENAIFHRQKGTISGNLGQSNAISGLKTAHIRFMPMTCMNASHNYIRGVLLSKSPVFVQKASALTPITDRGEAARGAFTATDVSPERRRRPFTPSASFQARFQQESRRSTAPR